MRKSFTQLFGFLLLSVMMLFTSGLYAQESQSTVELYAGSVDQCYNVTNSYTSTIKVRDFIKMKSFRLTLNFNRTKFQFDAVGALANANPLLSSAVTYTVDTTDPIIGKVVFSWTNPTEVTIGDNVTGGTGLFDLKFKILNFPNNEGIDLFNSALTWDVPNCRFFYAANWDGASYQVETTQFYNGTLNVPVNYTSIAYTVTPATCAGSTATINVTSPASAGMKYYFNGSVTGSVSGTADATAPSTNTVFVVDANGCRSHLFTIPVSAPSPINFVDVTHEDPLCFNDNGEITFQISGGTAPYTYWVVPAANYAQFLADLNTSGGVTSLPVFTPFKYSNFQVLKPAGSYKVAVNDGNACLDLRQAANWKDVTIVAVTAQITYSAVAVNNTCNGYTDGSIAVSAVAGGTGSVYTATIDGIHWFATPYTFTALAAKSYSVSVKDVNGCTVTKAVAVTQPGAIVFSNTVTYTDASCALGTTGSISIPTVTGGTAPYTFAVALAGSPIPTTGWVAAAPGTISGLAVNYYSVWVKDANGCVQAFANQDLSGNILPIQAPGALTFTTNAEVVGFVDVSCYNGDFTLAVTAAGGVAPYTYSFDGGAYSSTSTLALTALTVNRTVAVAVKDFNGCITSRSIIVDVPTQLSIYSLADPLSPTCPGGTDGRITVNAVGGNTATASYQYSTDNITFFSNKVLALPEGATTVYVKDARGCIASRTVTIPALTPSVFDAAPTGLIQCNGNTTTQGIAITGLTWQAGRILQYFVSGTSSSVFTTGSIFVPASVNGVLPTLSVVSTKFGAGTYYIGARDQYGCTSAIKTVVFLQNPALQLASVTMTPAKCATLFGGTLTINTTGGNGNPSYAIVNNFLAISNLTLGDFQAVETYDPLTKIGKQVIQALRGTYYVVLRDICVTDNSIFSGPWIVEGFKPIALNEVTSPVVKEDITCHDANNGTITVTGVTGGEPGGYTGYVSTAGYTYKLYMTGAPDVLKATNTTGKFTGLLAGTYYVTITDVTNCPLYKTSTKTVVNPTTLTITNVDVKHFTCATANNGIVKVTATGGTGAYWLAVNASVNGTGNDIKDSDWLAFPTLDPTTKPYVATSAGVHKFYVKDANGCLAAPVTVTVLAPKVITPVVAVNTLVTCTGGSDGSVDINATGGFETTTPSFIHTYLFSLNSDFTGGLDKTNPTGIFTGLAAGTYTVYVKATNTPSVVTTVLPPATFTYPMVACTYQLTFKVDEPTQYSYTGKVIKHVACKGSNEGELDVTVVSGGTPFTMTTGAEYDVQLTTTASPIVLPGSWTRTTGKVAKFTNLPHAIYSVWIRDANLCQMPTGIEPLPVPVPIDYVWHKVASWEVMEPGTALTASVTWINDVTCFGGNDGKFTVTALGGDDGFGNTDTYKYAVKPSVLPAHVFAPDPLSPEWQTSNVFDKATAATWIVWAMVVHDDGTYCIVGGEGTGTPVDEWRVQVRQPQQVKFNDLTSSEALCFGSATGKVIVSGIISDAGAPYTFNIKGTDAAGNAVDLNYSTVIAVAGVYTLGSVPASITKHVEPSPIDVHNAYTVKVTDKNGCFNTKTVVVEQNPELQVTIVKADGAFICPGDNNGVIEARATGGTNWNLLAPTSYSYQLYRNGVVFTAWQSIPSFIVEVGYTWKVEVKDGNGCLKSDEKIINKPLGVTATLTETTCYGDAKASVIVKAVGEADRTLSVRYRLNTDSYGSTWTSLDSNNQLVIKDLMFANVTETENFYYFQFKDSRGCMTAEIKHSFVPTQHPLEATVVQATDQLSASLTITGGISPYTYQVGSGAMVTLPVDGNTFQVVELKAPATVVTVYDSHGCFVAKSIVVDPIAVTAVPAPSNNQETTFSVVLTFNRAVTVAAGDITGGTFTPGTGKTFTVAMAGADLASLPLVLKNTIKDAAGNTFAGKTFTYKVGDHVAPTLVVTPPTTPVGTIFTVGLAFSEAVSGVLDGVTVTGGTLTDVSAAPGGQFYTLSFSSTEQKLVTIVISNAIKDLSLNMNPFAGVTLTYTTGDFTAPELVAWTPTIDDVLANNHPTFKMTFSENVKLGAGGNLVVYKLNTFIPALTIPITADMIVGKIVTINYTTTSGLDKNIRYYVLVDGTAITDIAGNAFAGVSDPAAWTFKTGPVFATPNIPEIGSLKFKVYPNPFVEYVIVDNASKLSKAVVTNIAGQVVKEVVNPTSKIQLNELRSGIYFISLYDMDNVIAKTAKIVKR